MAKQLSLGQILTCGLEKNLVTEMLAQLDQWLSSLPASECWQHLTQHILKPDHPFALHQLLYETTFSDWHTSQGPPPAWFPSDEQIQASNIGALMNELKVASYPELHSWSAQHRAEFWDVMIQRLGIRFRQNYAEIVDLSQGVESPQWLVGARLNIVESCFHSPEDALAIVFQPEGGSLSTLTYGELHALTNRVANGLVDAGFQPGDAIAIDMPMTAESVAIYLGIVKAGCVVVSIADSFAKSEIATRLRLSRAKAIFTQDCIHRAGKLLPLYAKVVDADAPRAIVLAHESSSSVELRSGDVTWEEFLSPNEYFDAVPAHPYAYTNILFSSGTTGEPKAIPWTQTTPIKCAVDGHLHHDIHPGDVVAWPTNLGWMMGPWLIYASLVNRATIALYYGTPTERGFGQFVQDARVTMLGVVPSLVNLWKTTACMKGLNWSAIKAFSSTGECSNPQDMLFLMSLAGYKPIIEYCGGTEIGGGYITGTLVQPCAPSTFTTPALGLDVVILNEEGNPTDKGEVFIISPSIGLSTELLNKDHHQVYFADTPHLPLSPTLLRRHGDQMERLPNGYYRAHGRVDDTMNLGGIKVSSAQIEQVLNTVEEISETAAIAISPPEGGPSQLVIYAVVAPDSQKTKEALETDLQKAIAQHLNPLFKIRNLVLVDALPRTASNKVMRRVLRDQYQLQPSISEGKERTMTTLKLEDYEVSREFGFLPAHSPTKAQLPEVFLPVQKTAALLSKWMTTGKIRQAIASLPEVDVQREALDEMQLRRVMLVYSYLTHAYVWGEPTPAKVLPRNIGVPLYNISQKMGRPPVLSYASYALDNWVRINETEPIEIGNITISQNFLGGLDEDWFILIHIDIEAKAAPALAAIPTVLEGIERDDTSIAIAALEDIKDAWTNINRTMSRMPEACDPYIYYNRVRPYLHAWKNNPALPEGLIYEGVEAYGGKPQQFRGETGAQSAIVPTMDALFNIVHATDPLREYLMEMRDYMPPKHRAFVEEVEKRSRLRDFVKNRMGRVPKLGDLYNDCVSLMEKFRTQHLEFAARYIHKQTAKFNNDTDVGTGGTPFMRYLKKHRDESNQHLLNSNLALTHSPSSE